MRKRGSIIIRRGSLGIRRVLETSGHLLTFKYLSSGPSVHGLQDTQGRSGRGRGQSSGTCSRGPADRTVPKTGAQGLGHGTSVKVGRFNKKSKGKDQSGRRPLESEDIWPSGEGPSAPAHPTRRNLRGAGRRRRRSPGDGKTPLQATLTMKKEPFIVNGAPALRKTISKTRGKSQHTFL